MVLVEAQSNGLHSVVSDTVSDSTNLTGAKVNFNGQIKTTNASGNAVFKANKNSTGLYRVTAEDMKRDVIGSVEVASTTKTENVVINVKKKSE